MKQKVVPLAIQRKQFLQGLRPFIITRIPRQK